MINFLNLRYFTLIAEEKNITRVAEKEHISQQSLSNHIKKLESELGVRLFDRTGGLSLTYAGERLYEHASRLIAASKNMENEIFDLKESHQGSVRLGISYTRGSVFLPETMPAYKEENPFVKITVTENNSQVLEEYLLRGHIDLYIGSNLPEHHEIKVINLKSERIYMVVPKTIAGELYKDIPTIFETAAKIENFKKYPFLMLSLGNGIRKEVDKYLRKNDVTIDIKIEMENIETLFFLACRGLGITLYPEMFMKKHTALINSSDCPVCFIPLEGKHFENQLGIGYNKSRYLSTAARRFIEVAERVFADK